MSLGPDPLTSIIFFFICDIFCLGDLALPRPLGKPSRPDGFSLFKNLNDSVDDEDGKKHNAYDYCNIA